LLSIIEETGGCMRLCV